MSLLLNDWANTYYTDAILFVILLLTLAVSIIKRKRIPALNLLPWYLASFIILSLTSYYNTSVNEGKMDNPVFGSLWSQEYLVAVIEFLTFTIFFRRISVIKNHRKALNFFCVLMPAIFLTAYASSYFGSEIERYYWLHVLYVIEDLLLLAGCVLYFVGMYRVAPTGHLFNNAGFWVVSGLSFYCVCTLPITVISPEIMATDRRLYFKVFSTIYTFYIVLFLMIMRAYYARGTS